MILPLSFRWRRESVYAAPGLSDERIDELEQIALEAQWAYEDKMNAVWDGDGGYKVHQERRDRLTAQIKNAIDSGELIRERDLKRALGVTVVCV